MIKFGVPLGFEFLQWKVLWVPSLLIYFLSVYSLRYQRARQLGKRYGAHAGSKPYRQMTTNDAQAILKDLTELEFPKVFGFSIIFALFKTYGIPSVSFLLVATGQLADLETASKRTADTGVLILEFALNAPTSERTTAAIARMNYIHLQYQKAGKISNNDLLYTLSLFALEPARWVGKYEWRSLTDIELCACGTYWKSMGDAMSISYDSLPSFADGWEHGLQWLNEIEAWSLAYEEVHMVPSATNKRLADSYFALLCMNVPSRYLGLCKNTMSVFLGERLRKAMMYPMSPPIYHHVVSAIFGARKLFLRHCALPRPEFMRKRYIPSHPDPKTGRFNSVEYLSFPWYIKPTFGRRWGPRSWITRLAGRKLPGDDGNKYAPEGWVFSELGPENKKNKGGTEMDEDRARLLRQSGRGGCPFTLP